MPMFYYKVPHSYYISMLYHNIRLEERTCKLCQCNEIEHEIHYICRCNFLNVKPRILFNSISEALDEFIHINDTEKLIFLMKHRQRQLSNLTWGSILLKKKLII